MKPTDAATVDWSMYYHETWMLHDEKGPVYVTVRVSDATARPYFMVSTKGGRATQCSANHLTPYWPSGGAVQRNDGAITIGRTARRSVRRSSSCQHYYIRTGDGMAGYSPSSALMWLLIDPTYVEYSHACEKIASGELDSAALSRDLVLCDYHEQTKSYVLRVCGDMAGRITHGRFIPEYEGTPAAKLARCKLLKEGIRCL